MKKELINQFEGKRNESHIICDIGEKSLLSPSRSFADESFTMGITKLNAEANNTTETVEKLSSEVTEDDLANAWTDEYGGKYSKDKKRLLYVPSSIQHYSIKEGTIIICDGAFNDAPGSYNDKLTSIFIPDTVTHIGNHAFEACISLETIIIPNSVIYIGNLAFSHCYKINTSLPTSIKYIGDGAFWNCRSLSIYEIPQSVSYIGSSAFVKCYSITQINILGSIRIIKDNTFADCFYLTKVILPSSVTHIEECAFFECYRLEEIDIPNSTREIDDYAFEDCRNLTHIKIPPKIKYFGKKVFEGCESLNTIVITEPVSIISDFAFYDCGVSDIIIPSSTTHIGTSAFECCGCLFDIIIPESVVTIGSSAFRSTSLRCVTIPKSVASIGNNAFDDCMDLSYVILLSSDIVIGENAFGNWCNQIIIPIGTRDKFEKLLPEYKDKLVEQYEEENLSTEVTEEDLANAWTDEFGVKYSADRKRLLKAPIGLNDYTIITGTKVICNWAFCEFVRGGEKKTLDGISTITIPDSIERIGEHAFVCCDHLRYIYIPVLSRKKLERIMPGYNNKFVELLDLNNKEGWRIQERRPFSRSEIESISRAEVIDSQFGNSVGFHYNSGGFIHIPLVNYSSLAIGEIVNLSEANIVILRKNGDGDIMRVEAFK